MTIEKRLASLKNKVDRELEKFFALKIKQIKNREKKNSLLELTEGVKDFVLRSGKRMRPILFYYGYLLAGGKNEKEIIKVSTSIELIHSYFLIHDDIIDQDSLRHGDLSMHCRYEEKFSSKLGKKDSKHFGTSMAIIAGDLASAYGYEILTNSNFSSELKIRALNKMNEIISDTIGGQSLDLTLQGRKSVSVSEVFEMQKQKTAKYTIEGPLHLGAILAGASGGFLKSLSDFAVPLGIAFQIQDDIIGVFSDSKKTGKPVGADIREGKKTFLVVQAMKKANKKQKDILNSALGNKQVGVGKIRQVRNIIVETGSLEFSKKKTRELLELSKKNLEKIKVSQGGGRLLKDLAEIADFIVKRNY